VSGSCCANCGEGKPCCSLEDLTSGEASAPVFPSIPSIPSESAPQSPRPLGGIAKAVGFGQVSIGGVPVAPTTGAAVGSLGGWMLTGAVTRNGFAKLLGAALGAWAGWTAGQASGL
jgi:hypothetical protein